LRADRSRSPADLSALLRDLLRTGGVKHRQDVLEALKRLSIAGSVEHVRRCVHALIAFGDPHAALLDMSQMCDDIGRNHGATARSAMVELMGNSIEMVSHLSNNEGYQIEDSQVEALEAALLSPRSDRTTDAIAAIALVILGQDPRAIQRLSELARSQNLRVASLAVVNLGRIATPARVLNEFEAPLARVPRTHEEARFASHVISGLYNLLSAGPRSILS